MKKLLVLTLITTFGAIPAWSQSATDGTADPNDPANTPTDTTTNASPGTATGAPTGTATGTTTGTTAAPDSHELSAKLQAMTPEQREHYLRNHPEIRERLQAAMLKKYAEMTPAEQQAFSQKHPELAKRLANAAEAGSTAKDPGHPRVNEVNARENEEKERIANGLKNGSLTAQQAAQLQKGEQRIQNQEAADLAKNGGHLTASEQRQLNREENRESERISGDQLHDYKNMSPAQREQFAQSHPYLAKRLANASTAGSKTKDPGHPRVNEVNARENSEQQRIANGIKNGSLSAQQAGRLEKNEARIKAQEARDLAKNNGHLTKGEQQRLNREENHVSHRIHKDKEA